MNGENCKTEGQNVTREKCVCVCACVCVYWLDSSMVSVLRVSNHFFCASPPPPPPSTKQMLEKFLSVFHIWSPV